MSYPFKGQDISIAIDVNVDITGATPTTILYQKPDGSTGSWNATVDGENLVYNATNGEIDQAGLWRFQGRLTLSGEEYYTTKVTQYFDAPISV